MPTRDEAAATRRRVLQAKARHPNASFRELGKLAGCSHTRALRILARAGREHAERFGPPEGSDDGSPAAMLPLAQRFDADF